MLKVSGFHFSMSQKSIRKESEKKNKVLELSKYYLRIFFWIWLCSRFFLCPKNYPGKKTNTLNYPNTIRLFLDSSKNIEFFCHFYIFQKNWQCLSLCFCQAYRLTIAGCIKKWLCSKIFKYPLPTCNNFEVPPLQSKNWNHKGVTSFLRQRWGASDIF